MGLGEISAAPPAPAPAPAPTGKRDGRQRAGHFSTHVILGQLPTVDHMQTLRQQSNVGCVVSCVEEFELKKYDLDFKQLGFAHCVLPQEDFGRMPPQLIGIGVDFLVQNHLSATHKVSMPLISR